MQLTLPSSGESDGQLRFERGVLAGSIYRFAALVCDNPSCDCQHITLECSPAGREPLPPRLRGPVQVELDLAKRRIRNLEELRPGSPAAVLATNLASEMAAPHWAEFLGLYVVSKEYCTEQADLDQVDATFPADAIADGAMVGYYEILPFAPRIEVESDGQVWLFDDQYCVRPQCACHDAVVSFLQLRPGGEAESGATKTRVLVRYDYHGAGTEVLQDAAGAEGTARKLIDDLCAAQPDLEALLAKRHNTLRRLYRRAMDPRPAREAASKPGRNAPCPCGSGKKYKRCCGAARPS